MVPWYEGTKSFTPTHQNMDFWPKNGQIRSKTDIFGQITAFLAHLNPYPTVSSPSEHRPKTPAYVSKQYSQEILQAYISGKNSAHKHNHDLIEICTENTHRRDSCMKGAWEVLDEGARGSLTTHLQEVLPAARDEQSLTFKETRA